MTEQNDISKDRISETLNERREHLSRLMALQEPMERILAKLTPHCGITSITAGRDGGVIQFSSLTREQVLIALASLSGGKWEKKVCHMDGGRVDYETEIEGVTVLLFHSEPPTSCRIEEEVIDIPARKEIVRKLVCT